MNKKILVSLLTASICAAPFSAFAAEESVTAESLFADMQKYSQEADSTSGKMTMNFDLDVNVTTDDAPAGTATVLMNGDFDIKSITSPMQAAFSGTYNVMVDDADQGNTTMEMYVTQSEDGATADSYMKMNVMGDETGWVHTTADMSETLKAFDVSSMEELQNLDISDLLGSDLTWELEEKDSSYVLSTEIAFSDMMSFIKPILEQSGAVSSDEEARIVEDILGSLTMNMSYSLDKETHAATSAHIDLKFGNLDAINDVIKELVELQLSAYYALMSSGGEETEAMPAFDISSTLNDFSMDMTLSYNDVDEILIPAEALAAEPIASLDDIDEIIAQNSDEDETAAESDAAVETETEAAAE